MGTQVGRRKETDDVDEHVEVHVDPGDGERGIFVGRQHERLPEQSCYVPTMTLSPLFVVLKNGFAGRYCSATKGEILALKPPVPIPISYPGAETTAKRKDDLEAHDNAHDKRSNRRFPPNDPRDGGNDEYDMSHQ